MKHNVVTLACLLVALCAGCDNKTPSKSRFATLLQEQLKTQQRCLFVMFPVTLHVHSGPSGPEALAKLGLLQTSDMPGNGFGPEREYRLSSAGQRFFLPQRNGLCYAAPKLVEVLRYSEPTTFMGKIVTQVTYTYTLSDVAKWALDPDLQAGYPYLKVILSDYQTPREATAALSKTGDGWTVEATGLEFQ